MDEAQVTALEQLVNTTQKVTETTHKLLKFANPSDFERKKERDWPSDRKFRLERLDEEKAKLKTQTERLAQAWPLYVQGKYSEVVTTLMGSA